MYREMHSKLGFWATYKTTETNHITCSNVIRCATDLRNCIIPSGCATLQADRGIAEAAPLTDTSRVGVHTGASVALVIARTNGGACIFTGLLLDFLGRC